MMFFPIPSAYRGMSVWGAIRDNLTFVVTDDENYGIRASVKVVGAVKFDGTRLDLGKFENLEEAFQACREFKPS